MQAVENEGWGGATRWGLKLSDNLPCGVAPSLIVWHLSDDTQEMERNSPSLENWQELLKKMYVLKRLKI